MRKNRTELLTVTGLFGAIICVTTAFIRLPAPFGYIHPGDGIIFLATAYTGPYGAISAAVGSTLADIIAGYAVYAPASFVIKGLMALLAWMFFKKFGFKTLFNIISFSLCELIMTAGYFIYECVIYSFAGATLGIPLNIIQSLFGIASGAVFVGIFKKRHGKTFLDL